jgi:hypothetical protein
MTPLLIAIGGMVAGGGTIGLVGWLRNRALKARYANACPHLTYSPWEDCQLQDGGSQRFVPGQKRECLGCGQAETRYVRPSNG